MRRLTYLSRGELRWDEAHDPVAPEAGAVVRPIASTTCDLDRAIVAGATPFRGPFAIGHEAVAEVVEVGSSVTDLRPGVVVAVPWHICCGRCRRCSSGLPAHCLQAPRFAMYGLPLGGDFGGLFDDLVLVPFAAALVPVPEGVDPVAVASASDNLTDAYRAVEPTLRARPGADVLVLGGTGSIGFYMTGMSFSTGRPQVLLSLPDVLAQVAAGAFDPREVFSDRLAIADAPQALAHGLRKPVFVRS
jgi:alcohol dehydrogenase